MHFNHLPFPLNHLFNIIYIIGQIYNLHPIRNESKYKGLAQLNFMSFKMIGYK